MDAPSSSLQGYPAGRAYVTLHGLPCEADVDTEVAAGQ
jgi:hypothetical protein